MTLKPIRITGELFYAKDMCEFNQYTEEKKKYVVQIGKLSEAAVSALEKQEIHVGKHEDKGRFITCKSNYPIKPVGEDGIEIDPRTIGNGSKAVLLLVPYEWKFGKKTGIAGSPKMVIVTELLTYVPKATIESEEDEYIL